MGCDDVLVIVGVVVLWVVVVMTCGEEDYFLLYLFD